MNSTNDRFDDAEVGRWGRYAGEPSTEQLTRFFTLDAIDLERVARARSDPTRLGYAVQLAKLRFLSTPIVWRGEGGRLAYRPRELF